MTDVPTAIQHALEKLFRSDCPLPDVVLLGKLQWLEVLQSPRMIPDTAPPPSRTFTLKVDAGVPQSDSFLGYQFRHKLLRIEVISAPSFFGFGYQEPLPARVQGDGDAD